MSQTVYPWSFSQLQSTQQDYTDTVKIRICFVCSISIYSFIKNSSLLYYPLLSWNHKDVCNENDHYGVFLMHGELFIKSFVYPTKNSLTGRIGLGEYVNSEARVRLYAHTNQLIVNRNSSKVSNLGWRCEQYQIPTIIGENCYGRNCVG